MKSLLLVLTLLSIYLSTTNAKSPLILNIKGAESENDFRMKYNIELLELALSITKLKYGDYKLNVIKDMNMKRAQMELIENTIKNFIVRDSITKEKLEKYGHVQFPVDLGIVGYRVFLTSTQVKEQLKKVRTLNELKSFSVGQGFGWLDTKILKNSNFNVVEVSRYESLFNMVAAKRFDLFPRGVNEIHSEYLSHKKIKNLVLDDTIALYYPLPRFFFLNKKNKETIKRIQEGLEAAYKNGSIMTLWKKYYGDSIEFSKLSSRKIFKLKNPFLVNINKNYEKYIYHP